MCQSHTYVTSLTNACYNRTIQLPNRTIMLQSHQYITITQFIYHVHKSHINVTNTQSVTYTNHTIQLQSHNSRTVSCNVQNVEYLKILQMSSIIHFLYIYSILSLCLVLGLRVDLHDVGSLENGHSHDTTHSQAFPVIRRILHWPAD